MDTHKSKFPIIFVFQMRKKRYRLNQPCTYAYKNMYDEYPYETTDVIETCVQPDRTIRTPYDITSNINLHYPMHSSNECYAKLQMAPSPKPPSMTKRPPCCRKMCGKIQD